MLGSGGMMMAGSGGGIPPTGLVAHLDAADAASYPGSGTTWANTVASPADGSAQTAYDFVNTGTSFVGTAGDLSAGTYWQFTGLGSYFTLAGSNTALLNSLHKDSANFTIAAVILCPSLTDYNIILDTRDGSNFNGIVFYRETNGYAKIQVQKDSGASALTVTNSTISPTGWEFVALSLDEAAGNGGSIFYSNGTAATFNGAYSSPTTTDGTQARIGRGGSGVTNPANVCIAQLLKWNRALTQAELDQAFAAIRGRYSL